MIFKIGLALVALGFALAFLGHYAGTWRERLVVVGTGGMVAGMLTCAASVALWLLLAAWEVLP